MELITLPTLLHTHSSLTRHAMLAHSIYAHSRVDISTGQILAPLPPCIPHMTCFLGRCFFYIYFSRQLRPLVSICKFEPGQLASFFVRSPLRTGFVDPTRTCHANEHIYLPVGRGVDQWQGATLTGCSIPIVAISSGMARAKAPNARLLPLGISCPSVINAT